MSPNRERFPWLWFLLLVGSVWLLWFSPKHRHPAPVKVDYPSTDAASK